MEIALSILLAKGFDLLSDFVKKNIEETSNFNSMIVEIVRSPLYAASQNVKYALIKQKENGKCYPKLHFLRDRLIKDEKVLDRALNSVEKSKFVEILKSVKEINAAMLLYVEGFNDEECDNLVGFENDNLVIMIDRYRNVIARFALIAIGKSSKKIHLEITYNLQLLIQSTDYSMNNLEN